MSDTSMDLAEVSEEATRVFGSSLKGEQWLHKFNIVFDGTPVEYLNNLDGKTEVLKVLNSIAYGGVV